MDDSDLVLFYYSPEIGWILMTSGFRHYQSRARKQWPEELPDRDVKTKRSLLQYSIGSRQRISALHPEQAIANSAMSIHHAFGLTGGTRRVDDVGQILIW